MSVLGSRVARDDPEVRVLCSAVSAEWRGRVAVLTAERLDCRRSPDVQSLVEVAKLQQRSLLNLQGVVERQITGVNRRLDTVEQVGVNVARGLLQVQGDMQHVRTQSKDHEQKLQRLIGLVESSINRPAAFPVVSAAPGNMSPQAQLVFAMLKHFGMNTLTNLTCAVPLRLEDGGGVLRFVVCVDSRALSFTLRQGLAVDGAPRPRSVKELEQVLQLGPVVRLPERHAHTAVRHFALTPFRTTKARVKHLVYFEAERLRQLFGTLESAWGARLQLKDHVGRSASHWSSATAQARQPVLGEPLNQTQWCPAYSAFCRYLESGAEDVLEDQGEGPLYHIEYGWKVRVCAGYRC